MRILNFLNNEVDKNDLHHIIRKFKDFYYKNHLCIVFELLNENLYELLKQNNHQGISLYSIRFILKQILEAVYQLQKADLIHCDLKPENILLKIDKDNVKNDIIIKITDFGSSCFKGNISAEYIQSRYYRAPETMIRAPYSTEIDMWSVGCIAAELFLGLPLFPGVCEYDQLAKIISFIGEINYNILRHGKHTSKFFIMENNKLRIKTESEYYKEFPDEEKPKYQIPNNLFSFDDMLKMQGKKKLNSSNSSIDVNNDLEAFVHLLKGLLQIDPKLRWNAKAALRHPFITKEKFTGYFNPLGDEISIFMNQSMDNSYISSNNNYNKNLYQNNQNNYNYNGKTHHSMIIPSQNYNNYSYNMDTSSNASLDQSCYFPNIGNIPLSMLKTNFPYAKIDNINLRKNKEELNNNKGQINPNKWENYKNNNLNNTYMMTSFDQIDAFNNSFTQNLKSNNYNNKFTYDKMNNYQNNNINSQFNNTQGNNNYYKQSNNVNTPLHNNSNVYNKIGNNMVKL